MTVQSPPSAPPPKKGGALKWVLIGCGLILLVVLGAMGYCTMVVKKKFGEFAEHPEMAAAKLVVAANPEWELVSEDKEAGTLTIRDKASGEVMTVGIQDIAEGKIDFKTEEGEASVSVGEGGVTMTGPEGEQTTMGMGAVSLPDWLPAYPNGTTEGGFSATTNEGRQASYTVSTADSVDDVMAFYEERLRGAGLEVETSSMVQGDQRSGTVTGRNADQSREVSVMVSTSDQGTQALVTFTEKNQ